ncbi:hypothetical protein DPMN_138399 [Dreissena polymorpha]|uniref:Uncharacterized protein n=1 Tax=Dreissena polymorpha TaxID=45954 RepID=A0A9D4G9P7_DREPO|nr:hypothetical protein DPMN_138399 [Dreissena polymorpha]
MSLCLSLLLAWDTAWHADHFLPDLVSMSAIKIRSSEDSYSVTTILASATFFSSATDVIGIWSWLVLPYSPTLVKFGGISSHLRRYLLMVLSKPSTVETAIVN